MLKFASLTKDDLGGYPAKIGFLVENRTLLEQRAILLQLFTQTTHTLYELPKDVLGADIIQISSNEAFDLLDLIETTIVAVPKNTPVEMPFPEEEQKILQGQAQIVTTRILAERNKYHVGQRVMTPWGIVYTVSRLKKCRKLTEHPYYDTLTPAWKEEIGINRFTVCTLERLDTSRSVLTDKDYYLYGVLSSSIPKEQLPITDLRGRSPASLILVKISDQGDIPPFTFLDTFTLSEGMIENYQDKKAIKTTVGRYLMNYLILVKPFDTMVTYKNEVFKPEELDAFVAKGILNETITRDQYNDYMDYGYFIGQFTELGVACLSIKSLTTDPNMHAVRDKLLKENKDRLVDPVTMTEIESKLIKMDKEWIKGDISEAFYAVTAKKSYNELRKKLYITMGVMSAFDTSANTFSIIPTSLSEGWRPQDIPTLANEARRGSYGRAKGTAKGGEATKYLLRVFQNVSIAMEDCGTTMGLTIVLTQENYQAYRLRYGWHNGKYQKFTEEALSKLLGQTIIIRSPTYCKSPKGYCYKCCGGWFEDFKYPNIGMMALDVGATFTNLEMKAMHTSGVNSMAITDLTPYLFASNQ